MPKKLTKRQLENLLNGCHSKFLKIFSNQGMNNYVTPDDLKDMLKIINRVNGRLSKQR